MAITVVIGDDHVMVREILRSYLEMEGDIQVVGEASTGLEVLETMTEARATPDVVLLDVRMPEMGGVEAARQIRERFPSVAVIMLSAYDDDRFVVEAVRAGVLGYVLKTQDAEHLIQAVRLVASGHMIIDPQVAMALTNGVSAARRRDRATEALTGREVQVLQLLASGHTNKEVAQDLAISPDTVKTHLEHVFEKLGASDRTAAVAEALRRGLIE